MDVFEVKTWKNREVEFPNRRRFIPTGLDGVFEVERDEGIVFEDGDSFDDIPLNEFERRIQRGFEKLLSTTTINKYSYEYTAKTHLLLGQGKFFWFTPTTSYIQGDMIYVNNVAKNAVNNDYNPLPSGAWEANAEVLCMLTENGYCIVTNARRMPYKLWAGTVKVGGKTPPIPYLDRALSYPLLINDSDYAKYQNTYILGLGTTVTNTSSQTIKNYRLYVDAINSTIQITNPNSYNYSFSLVHNVKTALGGVHGDAIDVILYSIDVFW